MIEVVKKEIVAEGIETQEQAAKLLEFGCQIGQGYYYGKPEQAQVITDCIQAKVTPA